MTNLYTIGAHQYSLSTIVFFSLFCICIASLIAYKIGLVIQKKRDERMTELLDEPTEAVHRIVHALLNGAIMMKCNLIFLGTPLERFKLVKYEVYQEFLDSQLKEMEEFEKKLGIELASETNIPNGIPIWFCDGTVCYQFETLPAFLYKPVINTFLLHVVDGFFGDYCDSKSRVRYSFGTENNGSYSIRINDVKNID